MRRYNIRVPSDPQPDSPTPHRRAVYAAEAMGLLRTALVLLVLTLIRYWRVIHWSGR
jgi:hypothetical protein